MKFLFRLFRLALSLSLCTAIPGASSAQDSAPTGTLRGVVADPSGAVIPGAIIHVENRKAPTFHQPNSTAGPLGEYLLTLPPGTYEVTIVSPGFDPLVTTATIPRARATTTLNATLNIATDSEQVNVFADTSSTSAAANKSALVLGEKELATMSDNDDTFQQQIQALAGADPMQPSGVYVDGFSGGQIPPKESIREIRINSNPFSAQFQELGFGRVEIFTKPGADKLHANISVFSNDSPLNAQNPYSGAQPPYYMLHIRGNVSGPIGKKTSYFLGVRYNNSQNNSVINALASETSNAPVNLVVPSPTVSEDYTLRLDRQVTANNVLTVRWEFQHTSLSNCGLSGCTPFSGDGPPPAAISAQILRSEAYNGGSNTSTLQLSDSQNIGKNKVLETRFQWIRNRSSQLPVSTATTLNVSGYFNGGGSPSQTQADHSDQIEFQEYFSLEHGKHFYRIGGRYRGNRDANLSNANFNGSYTYSPYTPPGSSTVTATALQNYNTLTPSQFIVTVGNPKAAIYTGDLGVYADDEYKVRNNVTLNYGMRFETQSAIPDHFDPAPRVGAAWDVGKTDKRQPFVTLRVGMGIFYNRFQSSNLLTAVRRQGSGLEQQYVFTLPGNVAEQCTFIGASTPSCPNASAASSVTPYSVSPNLRSNYQVVEGVTAERGTKYGKVSATYLHVQGVHQWDSRNINAPLPGTYVVGDSGSGTRPFGGTQNLYQFESNGTSTTNFIMGNAQLNFSKHVNFWIWTGDRVQNADTGGATSFPTDQYNVKADYGRSTAAHFRLFTGGSVDLPWGLELNPFVAISSETPYNITTGNDSNGDTQYNDRPSFATVSDPTQTLYHTSCGDLHANPDPGEKIVPVNCANGPRFAYTEMYVSKSFHFGPALPAPPAPKAAPGKPAPKPEPPQLKYRLTFAAEVDNIFNHPNRSQPVGVLSSPDFGKTLSLNSTFIGSPNANRMIFLATSFHF